MVSEAHENTFLWILEADEAESDQRLYWITGKAGSGGSTLMKFFIQPYSTRTPKHSMGPIQIDTHV